MSEASIELERANDSTLPYVETLLAKNSLPSEDVRSKSECFSIGYDDAEPIGVGGIEIYGTDGLLRSVVIERSARGNGFGTALCDELEIDAAAAGVKTLYLLTTTATGFFANRGYREIERDEAPLTLQHTTEFDDLCPVTATSMKKSL